MQLYFCNLLLNEYSDPSLPDSFFFFVSVIANNSFESLI
jgi:hypothetical protein